MEHSHERRPFGWKQHHSSTMCTWVALKENVKSARKLWIITEVRSNQGFLRELQKKLQETKATGSWYYDMERSRKEMCGKILRTCK